MENRVKINPDNTLPLCLHINKHNNIRTILNPIIEKDTLGCEKSNPEEDIITFYVIPPDIRPVPSKYHLFCMENKNEYPYVITSIKPVYDPFEQKLSDCTMFIASSLPLPYTYPLYLHKINNVIYPSFDKIPPFDSKNINWSQEDISPIYVTKQIVGYKCYNGWRCIPDINYKDTITDCIIKCNISLENEPNHIFDLIKYNEHISVELILIVIGLFYIYIITVVYMSSENS